MTFSNFVTIILILVETVYSFFYLKAKQRQIISTKLTFTT